MKIEKKPVFIAVAVLVCIAMIFSTPAWSKDTYKIGGIFSVTGRASFLGDPEKRSMEMAVKTINDNGGIDGKMLEAVIYDTEGDPTKAVMSISKLISRDRVIAIIGPSTTPTTLAVMPFAQKAKIPLISCAAGNKITQPVNPYIFKTAQSDVLAVAAIYKHMQDKGIKSAGILTVSNSFGESGRQQLEKQAKNFGINIVKVESFGAKDTDMTPQLTKIRSAKPDAVVCWGTNPGPAVVAKNVKQLKMDIPLYQSHGVASPKFIDLAKDAAEGIILPTGKILVADLLQDADVQKKVLDKYIDEYKKSYNLSVSGFGGYAYDAMNILAKALKGSDGDTKKIRDALENLKNHVGVSGVFSYSKEEHNGLGPDAFVIVRIKNSGWELVK
ncbi:ABC transporter substrate-binding protein [Desulfobacterales bacterium HSG16]|nr:ABC transporter substrate-binding protein [Desulfobacterales bacterium HSG16]